MQIFCLLQKEKRIIIVTILQRFVTATMKLLLVASAIASAAAFAPAGVSNKASTALDATRAVGAAKPKPKSKPVKAASTGGEVCPVHVSVYALFSFMHSPFVLQPFPSSHMDFRDPSLRSRILILWDSLPRRMKRQSSATASVKSCTVSPDKL